MFHYRKEQKIISIGKFVMGGQPGELPTTLFGAIFSGKKYRKSIEKKDLDHVAGCVQTALKLSDETKNPFVLDVSLDRKENLRTKIEKALELIPDDIPLSLDMISAEVAEETLKYVHEHDITDRCILSTINVGITEREKEALKRYPPKNAIALAYNPSDYSADGRMEVLKSGANFLDKGLIPFMEEVEIKNVLIDTAATPFDRGGAEAIRAIAISKATFGLPTGCAIHNTIESWSWAKKIKKLSKERYATLTSAAGIIPVLFGANFLLFGPIEHAECAFELVSMADVFVAEGSEYFGVKTAEDHPRWALK